MQIKCKPLTMSATWQCFTFLADAGMRRQQIKRNDDDGFRMAQNIFIWPITSEIFLWQVATLSNCYHITKLQ
ncbi:hypothetical protein C5H23_04860 [Xylella fastidiosa]|nr:hypothetical protein M233_04690 [Xylella fastidiosa subsp. multiplex Griffin-1]KFA42111.1 hypothetical protein DF22_001240 [Xylella fastidiosa]OMJ99584.1 hypothetical protein XYFPCFBP8417_06210 [Xylella fastidiosa subsp. multiplex]MDS9989670.1 hypothetical protein [Xylella fastidiosa]RWA37861.1 hypothetical protein XfCFBP8078_05615 [Xylella fastidiosa subsp. multiplex]